MTRGYLAVLVGLGLHCDRPVVDAGRASGVAEAASPAATVSSAQVPVREAAAARTIASIHYGNQTASGGVELTCMHDGAATGSYFNPGFSSAGAEIVPVTKTMTSARVADLWAAAGAVADASPGAREAPDPSWHGSSTIVLHFSEGSDVVLCWPSDGAHKDKRVQQLAALLGQVLSDR